MAPPAKSAIFRGDAEGMVDALVAACQAAKNFVPEVLDPNSIPLRDLQPYYGTVEASWDESNNPSAAKAKASKGSKRKGSPPQQRAGSPNSAAAAAAGRATSVAHKKHETAAGRRAAQQPVNQQDGKVAAKAAPRTPSAGVKHDDGNDNSKGRGASPLAAAFACPAMFSSPQPQALPIPSSLLMRAKLCQAAA